MRWVSILFAFLALGAVSSVQATTYYWDGNNATTGLDRASGTWDNTSTLWRKGFSSGALSQWPNTDPSNADTAQLVDTAGTLMLNSDSVNINVNTITFGTTGYTIAASTNGTAALNLSGTTPTIDVGTVDATIKAKITGIAGFTKTGSGTLTLSGANTFTGGLTLNGGNVNCGTTSVDSLGAVNSVVTVNSASTIHIAGGGFGATTLNKSFVLNASLAFTGGNGATITGPVSGTGSIKPSQTGNINQRPLILASTNNTFTGAIGGDQTSFITVNSLSDVVGSGDINLGRGASYSRFDWGSGAASALTLNNRQIVLSGEGVINNANTNTANIVTINSNLKVSGGGAKTLTLGGANTGMNRFNGIIADGVLPRAVISVTKADAGQWILSGANTYSGNTTLNAGTLCLGGPNPNNDSSVVTIATAATLNLNFSGTESVRKLFIGTTPMAAGIYKAVGSSATGTPIPQITGTGTLTVIGVTLGLGDSMGGRPQVAVNATVTYTLTFSEDMDARTVSASAFGNAGTATIKIGAITQLSPRVFTLLITPTSLGTLRLQVRAGAVLKDTANNALRTTAAIPDDTTITVYQPQLDAGSPTLLTALAELRSHIQGTSTLTPAQINAHKLTIDAQKPLFGSSASTIVAALDLVGTYDSVVGPLWVAQPGFTRATVTNDMRWTICTVMQDIMDLTYTVTNLVNHADLLDGFTFGSAAYFPGACPPPSDPNVTHSVLINANFLNTFGWHTWDELGPAMKPTGNYLAPGSIATVTVPPSLVGRGYNIRVGCHKWDMSNRPTLKRLDRVTVFYPINSTETRVANPFGGGIYIEVPSYVTNVGIVSIQVRNAVRSPYFSAKPFHTTTPAQWLVERASPAPWADFQSDKFMMQVPTSWISKMPDPTQLMKDWDAAADTCNDLMGFPRDRGKETMYDQIDVNLHKTGGYPGYPTSNYTGDAGPGNGNGYSGYFLVRGPQYADNVHFHEHGHGYYIGCNRPQLPGEIESVINLLHVAVWNQRFGYSLDDAFRASLYGQRAYATLDTTAMAWMTCSNFVNGVPMSQQEKAYQLQGHAKFVDVARMFGWEKLNQYMYSFTSEYESTGTVTSDTDSHLLRLSKAVGVDMRPLFHFWGVPPANTHALAAAISANKLPSSLAIYNTLVHYQSLVPANNAAFRTFASNWHGRQPTIAEQNAVPQSDYFIQWTNYNESSCAAVKARAQQIIDLYFPNVSTNTSPTLLVILQEKVNP